MKRIWIFGIFCILLTVGFVAQNILYQRETALKEARADIDDLVHFIAMDMNRNLFGLSQVFLGIQNALDLSPDMLRPQAPSVKQLLDRIRDANQFITALVVVDGTGRIIHWTGEGEPPSVRDRNYFSVHEEYNFQGLFVSRPFPSRVARDQWIFAVSDAYRKSDETLNYVVVAIIDLEYFHSNYSELHLAPGEAISIASPLGDIYTRIPGHSMLVGEQFAPIAEHFGEYTFVRTRSPIDDRMRGISLRRLGGYPLVIEASYDEEIALAEWRKSAALVAVFGFSVVAVFSLFTIMVVRSQRKEIRNLEKLQQQATTDPLTQLANRRHAVDCANLEIKKAKRQELPLSFVIMDLDHFKKINDGYGHEQGDLVLQRVARILRRFCRQTDVVSRFGGEEFLLILPGTSLAGARANSEKIRKALEEDVHGDFSGIPRVTASFGVAQWLEGEAEFRGALRRADSALYEAKASGRNCVRVAPEAG